MLLKVFKHSFKAPLKPVLIICGCAPILSILLGLVIFVTDISDAELYENAFLEQMLITVVATLVLLIIATAVASGIIVLSSLLKEVNSDQAYLTFTLPVSAKDHVLARYLVALCYFAIISVSMVISFYIIAVLSGSFFGYDIFEIFDVYSPIYRTGNFVDVLYDFEIVLQYLLIFSIAYLYIFLASIFIKNSSKKYRWLVIVVAIILYNLVSNFSSLIFANNYYYSSLTTAEYQPYMLFSIALKAIIAVVLYFISKAFIKNNLNIE